MIEPFEYELTNPATWHVWDEPHIDPAFTRALTKLRGLNRNSLPHFRMVWGGTHQEFSNGRWELKYKLCDTPSVLIGHQFRNPLTGETIMVNSLDRVPDDVISLPVYKSEELGQLRHIIERWTSPEQLEAAGRFDEAIRKDSETGEEIMREFPREGIYDCFMILETRAGKYRAPDKSVLRVIEGTLSYMENTSPEQQARDALDFKKKQERERKAKIDSLWHPDNLMNSPTRHLA